MHSDAPPSAALPPALYVVATPIGNLGDITRRAVEVLGAADVVLAEDTRRTGMLLRRLDVSTRMVSAHEHNEAPRARLVVEMLREGKAVALVSDAGTPLLSDPGARIVAEVAAAGFAVVPIPGASALLAALVASGLPSERFTFYGFPPRKGPERTALLEEVAALTHAAVLYESPNRVGRLLTDLADTAGAERRVAVARELTKLHEEVFRGTLAGAAAHFSREVLGEIVVVVEGRPVDAATEEETDELAARSMAGALLAQGLSPTAAVKELRRRLGIARNTAYELVQEVAGEADGD